MSAELSAARTEDPARFRAAMSCFPSGVTIVTTTAADGTWCGFTATSFCSVSDAPPLVLFCLSTTALCHPVFARARSWVIQVVPAGREDVARRMAARGADKFAGDDFKPNQDGLPVLVGASAVLECSAWAKYDGGDHTIAVGSVTKAYVQDDAPTIYYRRTFHNLLAAVENWS